MLEFDVSDDAEEVVYSTQPPGKPSQIWVAALDRRSPPQLVSASGENSPHFGPDGRIVLPDHSMAPTTTSSRCNRDGSGRSRVVPYPIGNIFFMSPDRRWITTVGTMPDGVGGHLSPCPSREALPSGSVRAARSCGLLMGSSSTCLCRDRHSSDPGKTRVIPLPPGEMLPKLPPSGMLAPAARRPERSFPALTSSTDMASRPVRTPPSTRM